MQPHVVTEVEKDAWDGDGYADGETEIERTQPFTDIHLVEILEVDVTFPVPYICLLYTSDAADE